MPVLYDDSQTGVGDTPTSYAINRAQYYLKKTEIGRGITEYTSSLLPVDSPGRSLSGNAPHRGAQCEVPPVQYIRFLSSGRLAFFGCSLCRKIFGPYGRLLKKIVTISLSRGIEKPRFNLLLRSVANFNCYIFRHWR